jgi:hypothetical protein
LTIFTFLSLSLPRFLVSLTMMRLHAVLMRLLISLMPLTALHPHCLLSSLIPPSPLHLLALYLASMAAEWI